ncbi:MAG: Fur family transcriptional regulator [Brevibacterium sp.]|uniref:Fur family transcriptional regulator n=1 Tax=unclassified Brevibacterium TaxID=2614124 RepID=UPI001E6385BB|nr:MULTISPECIES: transcriptional repressor [unclassified Brevibacterium]MCD1286574.1 transcriptional repressor [Brevibacterium sp. CCUG 69071]MDK8434195.1 transcriptional repressor [Brevibacterium sp. H-BE7]
MTDGHSPKKTRSTAQKALIRSALEAETRFVSAQQLHRSLEDQGASVGLATVYRQLNALSQAGHADAITIAEKQLFRACTHSEHHHHLVCESCGKAVEIEPPGEDWMRTLARSHGFEATRHVFEIFGLCADCRAAQET